MLKNVRWLTGSLSEFVLWSDGVCVQDQPTSLTRLDPSGGVVWSTDVAPLAGPPDAAGALVIASTVTPGTLVALDWKEGKVRFDYPPHLATRINSLCDLKTFLGIAEHIEALWMSTI